MVAMDFLWPGVLLLLGLIPLLIAVYVWVLRRRRRLTVRYSSLSLVRDVLPRAMPWRRYVPFVLFLLALASLSVAASRPVAVVSMPANQTTIILAVDVSWSMCSTDIPPSRLAAAQAVILDFIKRQVPGVQVGIVAFSGFAEVIQPPTTDPELLRDAVESLLTGRRTAIGSAILKSIDAIAEIDPSVARSVTDPADAPPPVPHGAYVPAIIVLLTDGAYNAGPLPLNAAQQAADRGVRVYTIGFGTPYGSETFNCPQQLVGNEPFPGGWAGFSRGGGGGGGWGGGGFRRGIDEETLKQIADLTDGAYYSAESAGDLNRIFRDLPIHLVMRHETLETSVAFVALGALLAALAIALALWWNPLP
jgi:Ca-activated chloride channel family protein